MQEAKVERESQPTEHSEVQRCHDVEETIPV